MSTVYTTSTYRQQYHSSFVPLPHVEYWLNPSWNVQADYSKLSVGRGWRRVNRIRNEMDIRHTRTPGRCGIYHETGHNRSSCLNSQPRDNEM